MTTKSMSPLGTILADLARDLAYAQRDGRPLGPAQAEGAAKIALYFRTPDESADADHGDEHGR